MMRRLASAFPLFILIGVAALTWWIDQRSSSEGAERETVKRHDPDVIGDGIEAVKLGPDGMPFYRLTAANIVHFADDGTSILTKPVLVHYGKPAPITARANSAATDDRHDDVFLYEDVVLTRAAYKGASELTVRTSWMHAMPELGLVKTDRPVTIRDALTQINSVGLEFDNKTRTLKLLSNVRGIYDKKGLPADARP
ncbi:MAG: LPS export ABC transporter periplasmic protein LptC [Burkholderiales bacterium]